MNSTRKSRVIVLIAVAAIAALLTTALVFFGSPPPPAAELVPKPNGYDDLVAAGLELAPLPPDIKTNSLEDFRAYVTTHRAALERARLGLSRAFRVPTEYSPAYLGRHINDLSGIKRAAWGLATAGRTAELEGHFSEAATNYLAAMKVGFDMQNGGVLIDGLVGVACEAIGSAQLDRVIQNLSAMEARALVRQLDQLQTNCEPIEEVLRREHQYSRSQFTGYQRITGPLEMLLTRSSRKTIEAKAAGKWTAQSRRTALLQANLATHAFELEKGRHPKTWDDLVPEYLPKILLDPGTTNRLGVLFP